MRWTCRAAGNSFPRSCLVNFLNLLISFYSVRVHQYLVNFPNVLITFFAVGLHQSSSLFSLLFLELIQPQWGWNWWTVACLARYSLQLPCWGSFCPTSPNHLLMAFLFQVDESFSDFLCLVRINRLPRVKFFSVGKESCGDRKWGGRWKRGETIGDHCVRCLR